MISLDMDIDSFVEESEASSVKDGVAYLESSHVLLSDPSGDIVVTVWLVQSLITGDYLGMFNSVHQGGKAIVLAESLKLRLTRTVTKRFLFWNLVHAQYYDFKTHHWIEDYEDDGMWE